MRERLQKILARAGIASRRKAEELILQGRVRVNGEVVTELGVKADPQRDSIKVGRKRIPAAPPEPIYLALNKPRGEITSTHDPQGRPTVMDRLGNLRGQVYPVGRLDYHSEGLLLLTNDGDLANHILSAKSELPKTYHVKVNGNLNAAQQKQFRGGLVIEGRRTAPAEIRLLRPGDNPWYEVSLIEGRNQQIRRMFRRLGVLVEKLKRVRIGPIALGKLPSGEVRPLTGRELRNLDAALRSGGRAARPRRRRAAAPAKTKHE